MQQKVRDTINGYGAILRFVTPILIVVVGYAGRVGVERLQHKLDLMDTHFSNHLMHHQDLEIGYERRLTCLENKVDRNKEKIDEFKGGR